MTILYSLKHSPGSIISQYPGTFYNNEPATELGLNQARKGRFYSRAEDIIEQTSSCNFTGKI